MSFPRTPEALSELRQETLASARRYAPPDFDVETFFDHLTEHLTLPLYERKRCMEKAAELFKRSAALARDPAVPYRAAGCAWLRLAQESAGGERRAAARRAAEAARQANRVQPGEGDYNLACAFSLLEQHAEAAGRLVSALQHDPTLASQALVDPDLQSLWEARPQLRKRLEGRDEEGPPRNAG